MKHLNHCYAESLLVKILVNSLWTEQSIFEFGWILRRRLDPYIATGMRMGRILSSKKIPTDPLEADPRHHKKS